MKRTISLFLFSLIILGFGRMAWAQPDQTEINNQMVGEYVLAYSAKDFDTMAGHLAENAVFEDPANYYEGRDAIIEGLQADLGKISDSDNPPVEIMKMRSGNTYIAAALIDFNMLMAPGGTPEREYNFKVNFVIMIEVEEGKVVHHTDYVDSDAFISQLQTQMMANQGEAE